MTIKDKAKRVTKVEEVVTPVDLVKDRVIELLKESKKTLTVILIIGFLVWLIT